MITPCPFRVKRVDGAGYSLNSGGKAIVAFDDIDELVAYVWDCARSPYPRITPPSIVPPPPTWEETRDALAARMHEAKTGGLKVVDGERGTADAVSGDRLLAAGPFEGTAERVIRECNGDLQQAAKRILGPAFDPKFEKPSRLDRVFVISVTLAFAGLVATIFINILLAYMRS